MNGKITILNVNTKPMSGGARPGAGRKPVDPDGDTVRLTVRLSQPQIEWLKSKSSNASNAVRALIDEAMQTL